MEAGRVPSVEGVVYEVLEDGAEVVIARQERVLFLPDYAFTSLDMQLRLVQRQRQWLRLVRQLRLRLVRWRRQEEGGPWCEAQTPSA